jgi:hypothetical protein
MIGLRMKMSMTDVQVHLNSITTAAERNIAETMDDWLTCELERNYPGVFKGFGRTQSAGGLSHVGHTFGKGFHKYVVIHEDDVANHRRREPLL